MRLGAYPCKLKEGSKAYNAYGAPVVHERHRHRYEFNNKFKSQYEKHGMVFLEPVRMVTLLKQLKLLITLGF